MLWVCVCVCLGYIFYYILYMLQKAELLDKLSAATFSHTYAISCTKSRPEANHQPKK